MMDSRIPGNGKTRPGMDSLAPTTRRAKQFWTRCNILMFDADVPKRSELQWSSRDDTTAVATAWTSVAGINGPFCAVPDDSTIPACGAVFYENSGGPRTEPCGTPYICSVGGVWLWPKRANWGRSVMILIVKLRKKSSGETVNVRILVIGFFFRLAFWKKSGEGG